VPAGIRRRRPAPPQRRWLLRIWPQVHDTEVHLPSGSPWIAHALHGLQRLLHP
jgi:hypothetical protein